MFGNVSVTLIRRLCHSTPLKCTLVTITFKEAVKLFKLDCEQTEKDKRANNKEHRQIYPLLLHGTINLVKMVQAAVFFFLL